MKLSVTHDQVDALLRRLHAAGVGAVLLQLTGPGWIVEVPDGTPGVDLTGDRRMPAGEGGAVAP